MDIQPAPRRRRAERKSEAEHIDRSWDSAEVARVFQDPADPADPTLVDDAVVVLDDDAEDTADSCDFDQEFWDEQKPPHYSA